MGCDGYILNPDKAVSVELECYTCGREIHVNNRKSVQTHKECRSWSADRVPVIMSWVNLEER